MATIQAKISRGQKYWYIVESRRVNGKPRPVVLAYLGKAGDLFNKLQSNTQKIKVKSYSHGAVAAMLYVAEQLDICTLLNQHVCASKDYMAGKPIRNNLTVGATLLLAAMGRSISPCSKRSWHHFAKTSSLEYLLKINLSKIDSQHFWDLMDAVPIAAIEKMELALLQKVFDVYHLKTDCLFYDTTNFFTYIDTSNHRCQLAKRGKNKQKRTDLKQLGLALVVTKEDKIPLFHSTYEGNRQDAKVFKPIIMKLKNRMSALNLALDKHTLIFDRGNNSKENLALIKKEGFYYVGALTPYHFKSLSQEALEYFEKNIKEEQTAFYRRKEIIWGEERTVVVYISDKLKTGQIRGLQQSLEKAIQKLKALQEGMKKPRTKKYQHVPLELKIAKLLHEQHMKQLISYQIEETKDNVCQFQFFVNHDQLAALEEQQGLRILMTNRHEWSNEEIINAYHGQSEVELTFRNLKNPDHLSLRPQYHWTDQKIAVHYFICMIGYLLSTLIWREVKIKTGFKGELGGLLDRLNQIRLATLLESKSENKNINAQYILEEMSEEEKKLTEVLNIADFHSHGSRLNGVGVYAL